MTKKILIGAVVFFLIAAGIAGYLLFFRQSATPGSTNGQGTNPTGYQPFPVVSGGNQTVSPGQTTGTTSTSVAATTVTIQTLTHLYASPIAGAGVTSSKAGEFVQLTDRATGHMYSIALATSSTVAITPISDQTIPEIYSSLWLGASTTLLRYLDSKESTIKTYSATLITQKKTSTTTSTLPIISGSFLPDNIETVVANPAQTQIFYLTTSADGVTGKIASGSGTKASTIFTSAISDWNVQWPAASTIALSTKPASVARGYLYFLSTTGTVKRILGDIPGLVINVDPSTNFVAYSENTPTLSILNSKTGSSEALGINTIADKCAWSQVQKGVLYCAMPQGIPGGHYPDAWYQGLVSFSDSIVRVDANTGQVSTVANVSKQAGQAIDVENLTASPKDDYLIFTNKSDLSLWALRL